ncbi:MAG: phage terminase large subunit family protein [Deltaproteobacteria bacterium]|nr:phage terminase large subunit family protein [Deltaproteobacteria bacterium]
MKTTETIRINKSLPWVPGFIRDFSGDYKISFVHSEPERRTYRRRKRIPVSSWAERHRIVTMGPLEGSRYKKETVPYTAGIMDASFFPSVQEIVICAADQVGKSFIVDTCIGYAIDRDSGPCLYVYPNEDTAGENSRDRIQTMITKSPRLRSYMTGNTDDMAVNRIKLAHMQIYMAWAHSAIKLANKSIRYTVFDETDKYPETAGKREADPISKGEKRGRTYRYGRKVWKVSTPTVEKGPIWSELNSCQVIFDYHVCCPECKNMQSMEFENIKWPEGERDPEKVEYENLAYYVCPHCGSVWSDLKRDAAVKMGEWVSRDDKTGLFRYLNRHRPKKIGFHLPSWVSRFVGISEVAAAFLKGLADKNKLKDFLNSHKAEPWKDYTQEREENRILLLRDDRPRGIVPGGGIVSCLLAGVDTQDDGFWYEIGAFGWGMDLESWQVREGYVTTFSALEKVLFEDVYMDADENRYVVHLVIQDAMGHRTSEVYDFTRRHRGIVIPSQGVDTYRMTQPHKWSNQEFYPGTNKPIPGGVKLLRFDVNYYKNILAGKLEIHPDDPGTWHLHRETTEEWARHLCAEFINERGMWECPEGRPNHGWDCSVLRILAADILGVRFWKNTAIKDAEGAGIVKTVKSKFMS